MPNRRKSKSITILLTCLLTGTLDAIAAFLISYKIPPVVIFKFIASGWFGKQAMSGGIGTVLWGLIFHYLIATIFSVVFFQLYPAVINILKNKYFTGIVYGLLIWVVMNYVVLPFTNIPKAHGHINPLSLIKGIVALIICVGTPIALMADNYYKKQY
ncbi:hypothetical protein ACPPVU_10995 [Mucilaginibacter sp. McL0603]|uniref:hypothetical protein n=1 Tax=Mucilaginibacter sp. McL0603 TaxID=3415670 RepID=UPI003CF7E372